MGEVVNVLVAVAVVVLVVRWFSSGAFGIFPWYSSWSDEGLLVMRSSLLASVHPVYAWKYGRGQGGYRCTLSINCSGFQTEECYSGDGASGLGFLSFTAYSQSRSKQCTACSLTSQGERKLASVPYHACSSRSRDSSGSTETVPHLRYETSHEQWGMVVQNVYSEPVPSITMQ